MLHPTNVDAISIVTADMTGSSLSEIAPRATTPDKCRANIGLA